MNRRQRAMLRLPALLAVVFWAGCKSDAADPDANLSIRPGEVTLQVGQSQQFTATGAPGAVTWSTSNAAVATIVPETGFVTAAGRGEAQITAQSGSASASARVLVTVPPALALSAATVDFDVTRGDPDPAAATVNVSNAGDGTLTDLAAGPPQYSQGQPGGWLTVQLGATTAPAVLTLNASAGSLPAGVYNAVVPVTATGVANSPQNVAVTFRIAAPASIELSRTEVAMVVTPGGSAEERVDVTNGGDRPLTGLAATVVYGTTGPAWLTATLTATTAPAQLVLGANATGLGQGSYNAQVTVTSPLAGVAPKTVAVTLTVGQAPAIALSRTTVPFSIQSGGSPQTQTVNVTNAGGGTLTSLSVGTPVYSAGQPTGWLTATIDHTSAPALITFTANAAGVPNGSYTASVPVVSLVASNSPVDITVTLTVGSAAVIAVNPTALSFTTFEGGNIPNAQAITVTNAGGGTLNGLTYSILYGAGAGGWLGTLSWQNGNTTAPANLLVRPTTAGFPAGTYTATITISAGPGIAPRDVTVTYVISSFSLQVAPLFSNASAAISGNPCSNCHFQLGGSVSNRHAFLSGYIANGRLVCKITGGAACPNAATDMRMTPAAVALIQAWIAAGAPSN